MAVVTVACGSHEQIVPREDDRPDIVVISVDSLRHDHLGAYGYPRPTSPAIDALAAEGVRFTEAVSTTSWTLPAHAALFTGLYDVSHGVVFDGLRLGEAHRTLAEILLDAGYRTAGFFGGPYLHPSFGLDQGFETWESAMTRLDDDLSDDAIRREAMSGRGTAHADVTGPRTLERVEEWLETIDSRPFLLFLHMWDVHYDYIPPERYVRMFDPDYEGDLSPENYAWNERVRRAMDPRDLAHVVARYDGEIRFTDDVLAEVFERLERRGRMADALVVLLSDHGEEFFEHGGKGHRRTLFDEVVRIPLVIRWPGGIEPGQVVRDQVRIIDVMPTLLALAGESAPAGIQGRDLSPLLRGEAMPTQDALLELQLSTHPVHGLRSRERKLIDAGPGRWARYDLAADPGETRPRHSRVAAREDFAALRELTRRGREIRVRIGEQAVVHSELPPGMRQHLESLGYLDPGRQ